MTNKSNNTSEAKRLRLCCVLLYSFLLLSGFGCSAVSRISKSESAALNEGFRNSIKSVELMSDDIPSGRAKMQNDYFEEPVVEGSASKTRIRITHKVFGDLNSDGAEDAAIIFETDSGGSGSFFYLGSVINKSGAAQHVASEFLGDRIKIESVQISASGVVSVSLLSREVGQPMVASPTKRHTKFFVLSDGRLVEQDYISPE